MALLQTREYPLGSKWFVMFLIETLAHNLVVAGALEYFYRLGKVHREFELLGLTLR